MVGLGLFYLSLAIRVLIESAQIVLGMQDEVRLAEQIEIKFLDRRKTSTLSLWKVLKKWKDRLGPFQFDKFLAYDYSTKAPPNSLVIDNRPCPLT